MIEFEWIFLRSSLISLIKYYSIGNNSIYSLKYYLFLCVYWNEEDTSLMNMQKKTKGCTKTKSWYDTELRTYICVLIIYKTKTRKRNVLSQLVIGTFKVAFEWRDRKQIPHCVYDEWLPKTSLIHQLPKNFKIYV